MVALKLEAFGGLIPRLSRRLLPPPSAFVARNTKLLEGELRGFHRPTLVTDLSGLGFTVGRAYRIPASVTGSTDAWLAFQSQNTDIIRSPVLNDSFNRYYWASDNGVPQYNTLARIVAGNTGGNAPWYLGVPQPAASPSINNTGGSGATETRSYIYTFVTAYGEEGPPCNPTTFTGFSNATSWNLSGMSTTWPDTIHRDIVSMNIYRTVPNATNPGFFFVANQAIGATYSDSSTNTAVALNNTNQSSTYFPPDSGMLGWALMPQGYMVGFKGRNLYFTEQFLPHAWNPAYTLATEFEIVGLTVWGSTLLIMTTSNPYMGAGVAPGSFTMQKLDGVTPCLSRRGIVTTVAGAYFPTVDGVALLNGNGLSIVTQDLMTKEEWAVYSPSTLFAAQLGLQYLAFNSINFGFLINPTEPKARLAEIDAFTNVTGIETDRYTGNPRLIINNQVWDWDPPTQERLFWHWTSKEFQTAKFVNFGAFKVKMDTGSINQTTTISANYSGYDASRLAAKPLNTLGRDPLGSSGSPYHKGLVAGWTLAENRMPLGGSPLYPLVTLSSQVIGVRFVVYCNGRKVSDQIVTDEKIHRLPSGFKHDIWQFELFGNTNVYSVQVAETGKELAAV